MATKGHTYDLPSQWLKWPHRGWATVSEASTLTRLITALAIAVTIERYWLGIGLPLWLDETWTAMIATRPNWPSFWREAYLDVNAPLYYVVMKVWTGIAGTSNATLRLPSLLFIYAAAALPLLWRAHGLDRKARLVWGALILLWWPGIIMSVDARTYGLLLFASTAGAIAFMQALRSPRPRYFLLWAAICAVQVFSHYFAYFLVAIQGFFLVWRWRLELVRNWYTFIPFVIPLAWTAYHLPRLLEYGKPGVAWYDPTDFTAALDYTIFSFGAPSHGFPTILLLAVGGALWKSGWKLNPEPAPISGAAPEGSAFAVRCTVFAAVCTLAIILLVGAFKASLTDRYLVPLVPSMLLGVVLLSHRVAKSELAYLLVIIVYGVFSLKADAAATEVKNRSFYGYELPSRFVAEVNPTDLVFVWDHPAAKILDDQSLTQIGQFFLDRQGIPVRTRALKLNEWDNPNSRIIEAIPTHRTGIIWLYDARRHSAAKYFPPVISNFRGWSCYDARSYTTTSYDKHKRELAVGVLACRPSAKSEAAL